MINIWKNGWHVGLTENTLCICISPYKQSLTKQFSECIHASEKAKNVVQSQLIDVVPGDISSAYILKEKVKCYNSGAYTGGSGKSLVYMSKGSESKQNVRSKVYSKRFAVIFKNWLSTIYSRPMLYLQRGQSFWCENCCYLRNPVRKNSNHQHTKNYLWS